MVSRPPLGTVMAEPGNYVHLLGGVLHATG